MKIYSGSSLICSGKTETDSSGTRDYSTDFLLSRYLKTKTRQIRLLLSWVVSCCVWRFFPLQASQKIELWLTCSGVGCYGVYCAGAHN